MKTDYNQVSAAYDDRYVRHSYPGLAASQRASNAPTAAGSS